MRRLPIILFIFIHSVVLAQNKSARTTVFHVHAPASDCSIFLPDSCLWLEKDNTIRVKVRTKCDRVKVTFSTGKIVSQDGDTYVLNFPTNESVVISVYAITNNVRKLIHVETFKINEPILYFCGARVSSYKHGLSVTGEAFKAHSIPLDTNIPILSYDLNFNNGVKIKVYHGSDNKLTSEMVDVLFKNSQPSPKNIVNKGIFFTNIEAQMPDGSVKMLSPFKLSVVRDSSNKKDVVFNFLVSKFAWKKE